MISGICLVAPHIDVHCLHGRPTLFRQAFYGKRKPVAGRGAHDRPTSPKMTPAACSDAVCLELHDRRQFLEPRPRAVQGCEAATRRRSIAEGSKNGFGPQAGLARYACCTISCRLIPCFSGGLWLSALKRSCRSLTSSRVASPRTSPFSPLIFPSTNHAHGNPHPYLDTQRYPWRCNLYTVLRCICGYLSEKGVAMIRATDP